ncbi:MAG: hypothetical protein NTZ90_15065 [Proteobacteria bacterium]|nr:hypothetical protein [Pseudomonadota bacterium]
MGVTLQNFAITFLVAAAPAFAGESSYRGVDVWRDLRADHQGIAAAFFGITKVAHAARSIKVSPAAKQAYEFADDVIEHVDFAKVLDAPMNIALPGDWRAFNLRGTQRSGGYVIDYVRQPLSAMEPAQFLDFGSDFTVRADAKPIPNADGGFGIGFHAKFNTNQFSHRTLARFVHGGLKVIDPNNLPQLPGPKAASTPATFDATAWDEFARTLPQSAALALRYAKIRLGLTPQSPATPTAVTDIHQVLTLKLEALTARHPVLGEFIERLSSKFDLFAAASFKLKSGLTLMRAKFDLTSLTVAFNAKTAAGKLIPFDDKGVSHPEQAIDFVDLNELEGVTHAEVRGQVLGLSFAAQGIELATSYHDGDVASLSMKLSKMPVPTIKGYALGIFPTWAIDLTMPGGSLEQCMTTLTQGALHGSRGEGTYGVMTVDSKRAEDVRVAAAVSTEMIDNFYLKFGLRVVQSYLWPDEDVIADLWRVNQEVDDALEQDIGKLHLAEQGALTH